MPLELIKAVIEAINLGDLNLVKNFIEEKGVDSNTMTVGRSLLHIACSFGHIEIVKLLIEKGANFNAADDDNSDTPLHIACGHGYTEIVKLLIEEGVDLEVTNYDKGFTPLHVACRHRHTEIVKLLIEKATDLGITDDYGFTPLHLVCEFNRIEGIESKEGYIQIAKQLISHILLRNPMTKKPLYIRENEALLLFWDEQQKKINSLLEKKILGQEEVAKFTLAKIYQQGNTLRYLALFEFLKESKQNVKVIEPTAHMQSTCS